MKVLGRYAIIFIIIICFTGHTDKSFYTSGYKFLNQDTFKWTGNNNKTVDYTNWVNGQPDNGDGNENCIHIVGTGLAGPWSFGLWNDINCNTKLNFICEQEEAMSGNYHF